MISEEHSDYYDSDTLLYLKTCEDAQDISNSELRPQH